MQFKKILKENSFIDAAIITFSDRKKLGLMVLFDALFIVSFYVLFQLMYYFAESLVVKPASYSLFFAMLAIFALLSLIHYFAVILVYSFFKYNILNVINSLFGKKEAQKDRFSRFYLLNIIIIGIFLAVFILLSLVMASLRETYQPFFLIFVSLPYGLFLYAAINTTHSLFYAGSSIKNTLKKSFGMIFTRIGIYVEVLTLMALFAVITISWSFGADYIIRIAAFHDNILYLRMFVYFTEISLVAFNALLYFAILINRVSFYKRNFEVL